MIKRNASALGIDLSDRSFNFCFMTAEGGVVAEGKRRLTALYVAEIWAAYPADVVVLEAGTPSAWVTEAFELQGARVVVADPRKLRAVTADVRKSDARDARMLARLGLADEELLAPTYVRASEHRMWMALLKVRDQQVRARVATVLEVRSQVKIAGSRLPGCSTEAFEQCEALVPTGLAPILAPAFDTLRAINAAIRRLDQQIAEVGKSSPEVQRLAKVHGVGPVTALAFVAVVGDAARFERTRDVGAYLGMVPRRDQSGVSDPKLRITKAGSGFLRRLLVQCAHFLIGPLAQDCALRRQGLRKLAQLGDGAKKKVIVAIARKLAVLLLSLWKQKATWEPLHRIADLEPADAPQPVVNGECAEPLGADPVTKTAPPPATRTQSCTEGPGATSSANGSAGRTGASEARARGPARPKPRAGNVAVASVAARPATPSAPATPARAGDPAIPASASRGQPRSKRGRFAAEGAPPSE